MTKDLRLTARISIHEFMSTDADACVQIQCNGIAIPVDGDQQGIPNIKAAISSVVKTEFSGIGVFALWFWSKDLNIVSGILDSLGFVVHVHDDIEKCRRFREREKEYYLETFGTLDKQEWITR